MNVLYVATYEGLTGASYSLIGMINELKTYGVNPLVVLLKDGKLKKELENNEIPYVIVRGYPWVTMPERKKIIKYRFFWLIKNIINNIAEFKIKSIVKENNIDIIHINASTAGVGYKTSKELGIPCVWHIREFVEEDLKKEYWNKKKAMECISNASRVIAISQSVKEKFQIQLTDPKLNVIYNGVPISGYLVKREKCIFSDKNIKLIISGRIDPGKGHKELIEAISLIVERGIVNINLKIVGSSQNKEYEKQIKEMVLQKKIEKYVEFTGYRNDLPELYKKSDIAIVASKAEAFGRVTVEAMMAGTLVIGANTAGTKELIGENYGLLYEQGNAIDLADKIIYAMQNSEKMSLIAKNAREYSLQRFSAGRNAKEIFDVYETIK